MVKLFATTKMQRFSLRFQPRNVGDVADKIDQEHDSKPFESERSDSGSVFRDPRRIEPDDGEDQSHELLLVFNPRHLHLGDRGVKSELEEKD